MKRALLVAVALSFAIVAAMHGQQLNSGRNVNIVGGPATLDARGVPIMGDPYLQRQNEPSMACSSRNPLNCMAGSNDYRTVNVPGLPDGKVTGDAWLGLFWTRDGGATWRSWLLPGYPQDVSAAAATTPAFGYEAAADPTVRAGTNGLFYYTGIAFNRSAVASNAAGTEGKDGVLFTAVYIDDNNTQQHDTPFRYVYTAPIAYSNGAKFLDKPHMAVDIPRAGSGACTIPASSDGKVPAQSFPGGNVYVAYSAFMGPNDNVHTKLMFTRSTDCGRTWSNGVKLSESHKINQSASIAIHPHSGQVYVAWREFSTSNNTDQIVVAVSDDLGQSFDKGVIAAALGSPGTSMAFDQPSLPSPELSPNHRMFRTNSYPATCVAGNGDAYLVWSQRGIGPSQESRVMYTRSVDGLAWQSPQPVDNHAGPGHQFMPAIGCAGDKVSVLWYDQREDALLPIVIPLFGVGSFIADMLPLGIPARTLDVRSAQLAVGSATTQFPPSTKVSRYPVGIFSVAGELLTAQLQYNLENLPLFAGGHIPFIGDYIDLSPATTFLPLSVNGGQAGTTPTGQVQKNNRRASRQTPSQPNGWEFNTTTAGTPPFHAVWTDNRNVVPGAANKADAFTSPGCNPGHQGGSKDQNIYTARLTAGLVAGVYGNARTHSINAAQPLLTQRAYAIFVQNLTGAEKVVDLTIATQLTAPERASFRQFASAPLRTLQARIAPYSGIARTVYVSTLTSKSVRVDVDEVPAGDSTFVIINPDPTNPAPANPDVAQFRETHGVEVGAPDVTNVLLSSLGITGGAIEGLNPTFLNPTFLNPTFLNPNFLNPNFLNPTFLNPTFLNPTFLNPNFLNPTFLNPTFLNPTFLNPTFLNPTFLNPTFLNTTPNATVTSMTWQTDAEANTSSSYLFRLLSTTDLPDEWRVQLLIYRLYFAPGAEGPHGADPCATGQTVHHELLTTVQNPTFLNPTFLNTNANDPAFAAEAEDIDTANATFALTAGDRALISLQILHDGTFSADAARQLISAAVIPEAIDSVVADATGGNVPIGASAGVPLTFASAPVLQPTFEGASYASQIAAIGGQQPYTWADITPVNVCLTCVPAITQAMPPGLQLNAQTGAITGTPTQAGTWSFRIQLTDSSNPIQTVTGWFAITVNQRLQITTAVIPSTIPGVPYSTSLTATGGVAPHVWSLAGGTLPAGITLGSTGVLSGTTTTLGTFPFIARVQDAGPPQQTATRNFTLVVSQAVLTFAQEPSDGTAGAPLRPVAVLVQDGSGAAVPGVPVTLALANNPAGAALSGTPAATTDAQGIASFGNVVLDRNGESYSLAGQAAGATATSRRFNVGSISFEMFPDGSAACGYCPITNQFSSRGVEFSFAPNVPAETGVRLGDSSGIDMPGDSLNHSVSNPVAISQNPNPGTATGTFILAFPDRPTSASFRMRAPVNSFPVRAFDAAGTLLGANQIVQVGSSYVTGCAFAGCPTWFQSIATITNGSGIARVEIDAAGWNTYIDNLALTGALPLVDFGTPAGGGDFIDRGFYHPFYPGATLDAVELWLTTATAGTYTVAMTARQGAYDGPVVGTSQATAALTPNVSTPVRFAFNGAPVQPGSLVTFSMVQVSPAGLDVFYSAQAPQCGLADPNCVTFNPTIVTESTNPPLDVFRRKAVAIRIFGQAAAPFVIGPVGGSGGSAFNPVDCPVGSVGTALIGRAGDDIDQTNLWCSPITGTTLGAATLAGGVGGAGGSPYDLSCPAGSALTGVHGLAGLVRAGAIVVDTLGVQCTNLATGNSSSSQTVGVPSAGTTPFALTCPAGTVMTGFEGRQGNMLDRLSIRCEVPR